MKKSIMCICAVGVGVAYLFADNKVKTVAENPEKAVQVASKVGFISSQKLASDYYRAKEVSESLIANFNAAQKELMSMVSDYEKIAKEYQDLSDKANNPALNEEGKKKAKSAAEGKLEVLKQKENAINDFKANSEHRITQARVEESAKVTASIRQKISSIAGERGFSLILDRDHPGVWFFEDALDVTNSVLEKLNADQPKPSELDVKK